MRPRILLVHRPLHLAVETDARRHAPGLIAFTLGIIGSFAIKSRRTSNTMSSCEWNCSGLIDAPEVDHCRLSGAGRRPDPRQRDAPVDDMLKVTYKGRKKMEDLWLFPDSVDGLQLLLTLRSRNCSTARSHQRSSTILGKSQICWRHIQQKENLR